jgi:hypothetical protein
MIGRSSRRFCLAALAAALALAAVVQAKAAALGRTSVGAVASSGLTADHKRGSKFQLAEDGTVMQLCAYLDGLGGVSNASQLVRLVLYRDAGGVPGERVATSDVAFVDAGLQGRWFTLNADRELLGPGRYWIAIDTGDAANVLRYYADGTGNWYGNAESNLSDPSNPFGPGASRRCAWRCTTVLRTKAPAESSPSAMRSRFLRPVGGPNARGRSAP